MAFASMVTLNMLNSSSAPMCHLLSAFQIISITHDKGKNHVQIFFGVLLEAS